MGFSQVETKTSFCHKFSKWFLLSILVGILAGLTSAVFLYTLEFATNLRLKYPILIWCLPLAGLITGLIYHFIGKEAAGGNNLVLEEIHNPKKILPLKIAPMVFIGTFLTHIFGGSAGREGAIVQVATSLADQVNGFFKLNSNDRKILLMAGAGAGFGSALGAPIAGLIFGMEVISIGKLRLKYWPQCLISSFTAYYLCVLLKTEHSPYPHFVISNWNLKITLYVALAGILFGLMAFLFSRFTHMIESIFHKIIKKPFMIPFVGGILLVFFYHLEDSYRYTGLGIIYIQEAISKMSTFRDPFFKLFFTSLTVGTGFKGGEFVPLVFIGTTLGSALGFILPISYSLLAALGFAAVFAGAANTPLACAVMAAEIFGWKIFFYAMIACYMSYFFSGHPGIYKAQHLHRRKHHIFQKLFSLIFKK